MRKVLILDTSILCVWLNVPGKTDCGPDQDKWDSHRVAEKIQAEEEDKTIFVLPLATIIETGNHIAQAQHCRRDRGLALADLMIKSANEETPWAAFSQQSELWSPKKLIGLAQNWPDLANQKLSLGDATIKDVAEFYANMGYRVEILTGDAGLKAYQPIEPMERPRRERHK
ncbi:hypothetical protein JWZ98_09305 [Methylomonas sp. EFPC1]|uniref:hypothetical protein n=1 Tax=Methylomonas sp. EFPC1 TaxID=2812647 RepID=UPI0019673947|nr:hypothetical protein [Methylomonas sp. EFPC1]QSB03100.1 hypothetical protein JWZ98_09305 [Methylomonas sp. EFPC1]